MEAENGNILPHLDRQAIEAAYASAPGNEIASGKFLSPESSAALAANAFGLFFSDPARLPPLPGTSDLGWPAVEVRPEGIVRFPWSGGRHPCLDARITTRSALIGIESKRYEPFRPKSRPSLSTAYWRDCWGAQMTGYLEIRDELADGTLKLEHLDAAQLVKHALGLRTQAHRDRRRPALVYLFAEPDAWPDGRSIGDGVIEAHRQEVATFGERVRGDEVTFISLSYGELLETWRASRDGAVRAHAMALRDHFAFGGRAEALWRSSPTQGSRA